MNWKVWLKGLAAAAVGGGAATVTAIFVDPAHFTINDLAGLLNIAKIFGSGAIINMLFYLKQSPIPEK